MKNLSNQKSCCEKEIMRREKKGFLTGLLYGILPHTFCIAFIIFSIIGATTATLFFKKFLLNPYFFHILVVISLIFATLSAVIYLKRNGIFSIQGVKRKWRYLSILYGTTIFINLLLFMVIFPIVANLNSGLSLKAAIISAFGDEKPKILGPQSLITLKVEIPCPGHAPLIIGELKNIKGVETVQFSFPNKFDVSYDPAKTSKEEIISLDVFKTYKAEIINEIKGQVNNQSLSNRGQELSSIGGCPCGCQRKNEK